MLKRALIFTSILALGGCAGPDSEGSNINDIVGGEDADIADFPWQISMQTTSGFHFCGGSIINEEWILSAAHCVDGTAPSSVRIAAGVTRKSAAGNQGQLRSVAEIISFPGYVDPSKGKDAALLRLSSPLDLSDANISAIELVTPADAAAGLTDEGVITSITGWGTLSSGGSSPDILQSVDVPVISNEKAQSAYTQETITPDQLAAGLAQGGKDACQGDSGGPLVVPNAAGTGSKLAGIVSWGYGCADARYPGMYARVSSFHSWILDTIGDGGGGTDPGPGDKVVILDESNLSDSRDGFEHFSVQIPADATDFEITLSGGTGDADLYVRQGAQSTTGTYDCRPYKNGNSETCSFASPAAGTWFVSVRAYSAYSGVTLEASYIGKDDGGGTDPGPGIELEENDLSANQDQALDYSLDVPAGMSKVTFTIAGGSGDADMYVRRGAAPTSSQYDCRPYRFGNEEVCSFDAPAAGTYFVSLRAYRDFSGVKLTGDYQ